MTTVNVHQAKTHLSRYLDAVESGAETEVIIARNGKPAAKLVAIGRSGQVLRSGLAKGKYEIPDDIDRDNDEIAALFEGRDI